jgi:hypothetical protein
VQKEQLSLLVLHSCMYLGGGDSPYILTHTHHGGFTELGISIIDHSPHKLMPGVDLGEGCSSEIMKKQLKYRPSKANPNCGLPSPQPPSLSSHPLVTAESCLATPWPQTQTASRSSVTLLPDAIDLVVEDHDAKVEKVSREQCEGSPVVSKTGGWIYHCKYMVNASDTSDRQKDGQGEVEEEDDSEPPRGS